MWPVLTFATGIVAGALGVKLLKKAEAPAKLSSLAIKARSGLDKAGEDLRDAAVSGLTAVEKSSASFRAKLARDPAAHEPAAEVSEKVPDPAPPEGGDQTSDGGATHEKG